MPGAQGGGANADFDSLIDLIRSTVASETWAENGGGEAEIREYVGGVYADASGLLRRIEANRPAKLGDEIASARERLSAVRDTAGEQAGLDNEDPRTASRLRYVSIGRLEQEIERRRAASEPVDPAMLPLAGLRRVQYVVLVPPREGREADLVLAGPAGDWRIVGDGRIVSTETGESVVRLDDLATLLRQCWGKSPRAFGCSINPRQESLAAAQAFLSKSKAKPISPRRRDAWLEKFRGHVGEQDIEVFGVDPTSRAAGVLVEADHHMKLIGMGLADGVPGVESYLDGLAKSSAAQNGSTGVLRWWFAMNYSAVHTTPAGDALELVGPGAKVMSEKQLLTERGQRVAAAGDELAEGFAASFSHHFASLCRKYPVYSELRNLFDLSLAVEAARAAAEGSGDSWRPSLLTDAERLPLPAYEPARTVETVVNHAVVNRHRFVAGVSGGVWGDARKILTDSTQRIERTGYGPLGKEPIAAPADLDPQRWWWDAAE